MRKSRNRKNRFFKNLCDCFSNRKRQKEVPKATNYVDQAQPIYLSADKSKMIFLELDGTLVHINTFEIPSTAFKFQLKQNNPQIDAKDATAFYYVSVREGAMEFIQNMSKFYTVGIYTLRPADFANPIIDYLDPGRIMKLKFYSQHCLDDGKYKDLEGLNLQSKQILLIDNSTTTFNRYPYNTILVSTYNGKKINRDLMKLMPLLEKMSMLQDFRPAQQTLLEMRMQMREQQEQCRNKMSLSSQHSIEKSPQQRSSNIEKFSIGDLKSFERKSIRSQHNENGLSQPENLENSQRISPSKMLSISQQQKSQPDSINFRGKTRSPSQKLQPYRAFVFKLQTSEIKIGKQDVIRQDDLESKD